MRQHQGFTLLEVLIAIGIATVALLGIGQWTSDSLLDLRAQQAGQQQSQVATAAAAYLRNNYDSLVALGNGAARNISLAGFGPGLLPDAMLAAGINAYQQRYCLLLNVSVPALGVGQLTALLVTEGGTPIPRNRRAYVASLSGLGGGVINDIDNAGATVPIHAQGAGGAWRSDLRPVSGDFGGRGCTPATAKAGNLASLLVSTGAASVTAPWLARTATANRADLNTMQTSINMGGNDLNNARNVNASGAVTGGTVTSTGHASADTMQINRWFNADSINAGVLWVGGKISAGWVETSGNVNAGGAVNATGKVSAAALETSGGVQAGSMNVGTTSAAGTVNVVNSTTGVGTLTAGRINGGTVVPTAVATEGNACVDEGASRRNSNGKGPIFCADGIWKTYPTAASTRKYSYSGTGDGDYYCPAKAILVYASLSYCDAGGKEYPFAIYDAGADRMGVHAGCWWGVIHAAAKANFSFDLYCKS